MRRSTRRDANYSNWELSADRANSARRLLQQDGVRADQVTQVRGYADQLLRVKSNPYDPSNRRISILVKNNDKCAAAATGACARWWRCAGAAPSAVAPPAAPAAPAKRRLRSGQTRHRQQAHGGCYRERRSKSCRDATSDGKVERSVSQKQDAACRHGVVWSADHRKRLPEGRFHGDRCRRGFRHTQRSRHSC